MRLRCWRAITGVACAAVIAACAQTDAGTSTPRWRKCAPWKLPARPTVFANVVDDIKATDPTAATPPMPNVDRAVLADPALTTTVKAKFVADDLVPALQIDVDTRDGSSR